MPLILGIRTLTGTAVIRKSHQKTTDTFLQSLDLKTAPPGVYFVEERVVKQ